MKAIKDNKEYTINETQMESYNRSGYDILRDDGSVLKYSDLKTIKYNDHLRAVQQAVAEYVEPLQAAVAEVERLQKVCAELAQQDDSAEIEKLQKANSDLTKQLEAAKAELKVLQKAGGK